MSKRAGAVSAETREGILQAARDEFSQYGFEGSSLRRICAAAGVTTGALYFFFQGKDDLFRQVLSGVTRPFMDQMGRHYAAECREDDPASPVREDGDIRIGAELIDSYFKDRQTWDILLAHQSHPAVREFLDAFGEVSAAHYRELLGDTQPEDPFGLHQFVHMQTDAMLTLVSHNFSREEMLQHSRTAVKLLRGAFSALLTK